MNKENLTGPSENGPDRIQPKIKQENMYDHLHDYMKMFPDDHHSLMILGMYHFARLREIEIKQNTADIINNIKIVSDAQLQKTINGYGDLIKKIETKNGLHRKMLGDVQKELKAMYDKHGHDDNPNPPTTEQEKEIKEREKKIVHVSTQEILDEVTKPKEGA